MSLSRKERMVLFGAVLLLILTILPFFVTTVYSLPSADDFTVVRTQLADDEGVFLRAIRHANNAYFDWTGLWPYMFLETLISPLNLFRMSGYGYGIEMALFLLLYLVSLWLLLRASCNRFLGIKESHLLLLFYAALVFFLFNAFGPGVFGEVVYWFVGSSYLWAMIMGMLFMFLLINKKENPTPAEYGGIVVTGLMTGFFFQAAVLPGVVSLILLVHARVRKAAGAIDYVSVVSIGLGGVIALAAPGNYARHTIVSEKLDLGKAFIDTTVNFYDASRYVMARWFFAVFLIACITIGKRHVNKPAKWFLSSFLISMVTLWINAFPIALGYANPGLPYRYQFILVFTFYVGAGVTAILFGGYLNRLTSKRRITVFKTIAGVAGICAAILAVRRPVIPVVSAYTGLPQAVEVSVEWKKRHSHILNPRKTTLSAWRWSADLNNQIISIRPS